MSNNLNNNQPASAEATGQIAEDVRVLSAGARSYQLMLMAYEEAGLSVPGTASLLGRARFVRLSKRQRYGWFKQHEPQILLYPESYVAAVADLSHEKCYTFNFVGLFFATDVFPHRKWILDFARHRFDTNCYLCFTDLDNSESYEPLGPFDRTLANSTSEHRHFVPKQACKDDRTYFDSRYFEVLTRSHFTLCPRGDKPWSMRFFEAIMSRSIPVVQDPLHTGRHEIERGIGYRYYTIDQSLEYREDWVEENYERFIENQTHLRQYSY